MADVTIATDSELVVAGITGETEAGVDFVDSYVPTDNRYTVADSAQIVVHQDHVDHVVESARAQGLSVEEV